MPTQNNPLQNFQQNNPSQNVQNQSQNITTHDEVISDINDLEKQIKSTNLPAELSDRAMKNIERLRRMAKRGSYSGEFEMVEKYIYWISNIPWMRYSVDNLNITNAKQLMDGTHYGMETVKNLILDYLAVMQLHQQKTAVSSVLQQNGYISPPISQTNSQQQHTQQTPPAQPINTTSNLQSTTPIIEPVQRSNSMLSNLYPEYAEKSGVTQVTQPIQPENNGATQKSQVEQMSVLRGSSANAPVMIFVGLQGVGKTSIAKSIANAMGRKFVRISVGAMSGSSELRGTSRGVLDAEPGQIVKALVRCGSMNPVILLDEIDKAAGNQAVLSDIMASLLEILDPEQNSSFIDKYIDYPIDLSKVFFICTANNLGSLSAALLDRMEVIRFPSYSDAEKEVIAKKYAFPKVLQNTGISSQQLRIEDSVWPLLIRPVGFDAGLRQLERNLATLARSAARKLLEGTPAPIVVTPENLKQFVLPDQGPIS